MLAEARLFESGAGPAACRAGLLRLSFEPGVRIGPQYSRLTGAKNPGLPAGWQAEACPTLGSGFFMKFRGRNAHPDRQQKQSSVLPRQDAQAPVRASLGRRAS